ncbi:polysaccharide deacetylase family protein [Rhizobium sp. RAF56]|uniref:polysaccharide deacetylase family protein n=1 Tax=Rhizobium sp. RAF56 TaxID=3233062 RepID=UPI003F987A0C
MNTDASATSSNNGGFPVLMYHHIAQAPARGTGSRYMFVSSSRFRRQMRALKILGYIGCSIAELSLYLSGQKTGKAVGITFDDGYRNVYRNGLPILAEFGFTSTTYFVSRQVGGHNEWDAGRMPWEPCMSREELREWMESGQEVGAHTLDHARLGELDEVEARRQIAGSKAELENITGQPVTAFSYPFGSHNDLVVEIARQSGFSTAVTTIKGRATGKHDPMRLPRMTVRRGDNLLKFLWSRIL